MANPKIQVDITGDASKLKKAAKEAEQAVKDIDDSVSDLGKGKGAKGLDKLGDVAGDVARERLGPLGEIADTVGIDLDDMGKASLIAGAAVVGLGGMLANGVKQLGQMSAEARKFADASGLSIETSSRFVAVIDDFGISAESGAAAMGRLAKNIDAGKLEEFGIAAQVTADGTTDMAGTLGSVADAMMATADPTERAAMGAALFGKSWADLMPVLRLGSSGIRDAMSNVKGYQVVTEETEREQRQLAFAIDDMQDAFSGLSMSLAKESIPTLTGVANGLAAVLDGLERVSRGTGVLDGIMRVFGFNMAEDRKIQEQFGSAAKDTAEALKIAQRELAETAKKSADAAEELGKLEEAGSAMRAASPLAADLRRKTDELAEASQRAAAASAEQKAKLDLLNGATMTAAQSQLAYENATARVSEAAESYAERQKSVTEAVNEFGADSPEAAKATRDLEQAARDYSGAAYGAADAAVANAEKLAAVEGRTLTADEKTRIYVGALQAVRDKTNDPTLQAGLDTLIGKTQAAADAADRAQRLFYEMEAAASRAAAVARGAINETPLGAYIPDALRASGGPVSTGKTYMVGEEGPELFVPNRSGTIIPNDALRSDGGDTAVRTVPAAAAGTTNIYVEITTGADPQAVVTAIQRYVRQNGGTPW